MQRNYKCSQKKFQNIITNIININIFGNCRRKIIIHSIMETFTPFPQSNRSPQDPPPFTSRKLRGVLHYRSQLYQYKEREDWKFVAVGLQITLSLSWKLPLVSDRSIVISKRMLLLEIMLILYMSHYVRTASQANVGFLSCMKLIIWLGTRLFIFRGRHSYWSDKHCEEVEDLIWT